MIRSVGMSMNLQFQIQWFLNWIQSDFYRRFKLVKIKIANFNFNQSYILFLIGINRLKLKLAILIFTNFNLQ